MYVKFRFVCTCGSHCRCLWFASFCFLPPSLCLRVRFSVSVEGEIDVFLCVLRFYRCAVFPLLLFVSARGSSLECYSPSKRGKRVPLERDGGNRVLSLFTIGPSCRFFFVLFVSHFVFYVSHFVIRPVQVEWNDLDSRQAWLLPTCTKHTHASYLRCIHQSISSIHLIVVGASILPLTFYFLFTFWIWAFH